LNTYFARQPILNSQLHLYGYELLFRPTPQAQTSGALPVRDGDRATASVLEAFSSRGIDKVTGGKKAFINFTQGLLVDNIALHYPKEFLVVEVLEDIDPTPKVMEALLRLKGEGYTIALDDYVYTSQRNRLLDLADIIKIEVGDAAVAIRNLEKITANVNLEKCLLLAEKVETQQVFEQTRALGCQLFQGYFFARPALVTQPTVSPLHISLLQLVREVGRADIDFKNVADILKRDVALSYKILRLVNSSYFGRANKIESIQQAVVMLGTSELKKWMSFVALTNICEDKPNELVLMSLTRANFCEAVAGAIRRGGDADAFFLAGMFSMLDAMMDVKMEMAVEGIVMPALTQEALLRPDNIGRDAINLMIGLEQGNWDDVGAIAGKLGLAVDRVSEMYYDALYKGNALAGEIREI
jgi:EAL and modified HD-GYP domain-containing signal transduction protein